MAETGGRVVQQECQRGSRVSRTLRCVVGRHDAAVTDACVEREWIRFNDHITIIPLEMTSNSPLLLAVFLEVTPTATPDPHQVDGREHDHDFPSGVCFRS
jgi:hypothetical protein